MTAVSSLAEYGGLSRIGELLAPLSGKRILLVTGRGSYKACGAQDVLDVALADYDITRFFDFDLNPKLEDGLRGAQIANDINADIIIAVGGGSPMDIAKLIKAFRDNPNQAEDMVRGKIPVPQNDTPLIMVPTTAGSGSEATHFAVVYIGKEKFSLAAPELLPDAYILDGKLLATASPYQRAVNGLDALAQATEGAWAVKSTAHSRALSYTAIEALVKHLPGMINENKAEALQAVMVAANEAGQVINITKTTAPHAFSYAFTSYHDIPHGHAVWMTLPAVFARHMAATPDELSDPRGALHYNTTMKRLAGLYGLTDAATAEAQLKRFMASLGTETDMEKMGASDPEQRRNLSGMVNMERMSNNPVNLSQSDIDTIFRVS